jgi:DNA-binding transcriptional LysR family regulator
MGWSWLEVVDVELKWLEDFVAVARTGSFSQAARQRHVTQPAFTRRIRALEHWLGVRLIDRSSLPVRLTTEGESFLPQAREMIALARTARQDFHLGAGSERRALRIVTLHTLALHLVPQLLRPMMSGRPDIAVEVIASVPGVEASFEGLEVGLGDVVIAYEQENRVPAVAGFEARLLLIDRLVPVARPDVAARVNAGGGAIPLLHYPPASFTHDLVQPMVRRLGARARVRALSTLGETLRAMALDGFGVAWLPELILGADLASGRLVEMQMPGQALAVPLQVQCWTRQSDANPLVRLFLDSLARDAPPSR